MSHNQTIQRLRLKKLLTLSTTNSKWTCVAKPLLTFVLYSRLLGIFSPLLHLQEQFFTYLRQFSYLSPCSHHQLKWEEREKNSNAIYKNLTLCFSLKTFTGKCFILVCSYTYAPTILLNTVKKEQIPWFSNKASRFSCNHNMSCLNNRNITNNSNTSSNQTTLNKSLHIPSNLCNNNSLSPCNQCNNNNSLSQFNQLW